MSHVMFFFFFLQSFGASCGGSVINGANPSSSHTLPILALPQAPTNVRVSDKQPTSVRLSWSYDGDVSSDVQYYVIQYKPKAATWDYKEISGAITNFYDIRGLR